MQDNSYDAIKKVLLNARYKNLQALLNKFKLPIKPKKIKRPKDKPLHNRYQTLSLREKEVIVIARFGSIEPGKMPVNSMRDISTTFKIPLTTVRRTVSQFVADKEVKPSKRGVRPNPISAQLK